MNLWLTEHIKQEPGRVCAGQSGILMHIFIGENRDVEPCWFGNLISCQARSGWWVVLSESPAQGFSKCGLEDPPYDSELGAHSCNLICFLVWISDRLSIITVSSDAASTFPLILVSWVSIFWWFSFLVARELESSNVIVNNSNNILGHLLILS